MIVNQANLADFFRGLQVIFKDAFVSANSQFDRVATTVPSTGSEEHYGWLNKMPQMRQWLGDRVLQSLSAGDFTIKNIPYESTIEVSRFDLADDKLGLYSPLTQQMGNEAKTHPDTLVFPLLQNGFTGRCFDGQYFFDTSHPVKAADGTWTTWSNNGGGSGTPWFLLSTSRPLKPLIFQKRQDYILTAMTSLEDEAVFMRAAYRFGIDARVNAGYGLPQLAYGSKQTLDSTAYGAARASMMSVKGDYGKPLGIMPDLLVVPPALEGTARRILLADRDPNGATNVYQNTAQLLVTPWLA